MTVHRALAVLLCLLSLVAVACGGSAEADPDDASLLARGEAERLDQRVTRIGQLAAEGRCEAAQDNLRDYAFQVDQLPERRDPELRARLEEGAANLERTLASQCEEPEPATTETATTETTPPPVTTTDEVPTEPPATETQPVEPAPGTEPVPAPVPSPEELPEGGAGDEGTGGGNGNGNGNGGGNGNGNQGNGNGNGGAVPDDSGGVIAPEDDG